MHLNLILYDTTIFILIIQENMLIVSYQSFISTNKIERVWRSSRNQNLPVKGIFSSEILKEYLETLVIKSMLIESELYDCMLNILKLSTN